MAQLTYLVLLLFIWVSAWASPPPNADPRLAPWFQSLINKHTGGSCCSIADCRNLPVKIVDGHYEVLYNNEWLSVPPDVISERVDNPTGDYVSCVRDFYAEGIPSPQIDCFILSPRT